jgi:hypothetical protein
MLCHEPQSYYFVRGMCCMSCAQEICVMDAEIVLHSGQGADDRVSLKRGLYFAG